MELFVFATQVALSMSLISHRIGSFTHKNIFPNELRVSAIGFCCLFSLVFEQIFDQILMNSLNNATMHRIQLVMQSKFLIILLAAQILQMANIVTFKYNSQISLESLKLNKEPIL